MVSDQILSRLIHADEEGIREIVSKLPHLDRARLAVFCYSRSHLRNIGLAIADHCPMSDLIEASGSNALAQMLSTQAHGQRVPAEKVRGGRRAITLATAANVQTFLAAYDAEKFDDADLELAEDEPHLETSH